MAKALDTDLAEIAKVVALVDAAPVAKTPMKMCERNDIVGHDPPTADYETLRMLAGKSPTFGDDGAFAWLNSAATSAWIDHHAGKPAPSGGYGQGTERQLAIGRKLLVVYRATSRRVPVVTAEANAQRGTKGKFTPGYFVGFVELVDRSQNKVLCWRELAVGTTHDISNKAGYSSSATLVLEDLRKNVQLAAFDAINGMAGRDVLAKDPALEQWREEHPTPPKPER